MNIIYFGDFNPEYIRNRVIISGLKENGIEVTICHAKRGPYRVIKLLIQYWKIRRTKGIVIVGSSDTSRWLVFFMRVISRKKIVWDAHYSIYDMYVNDRGLAKPTSLKAKYYWFIDWMACTLADNILLDTNNHAEYFSRTFNIKREKFTRIFVGADRQFLLSSIDRLSSMIKNENVFLVNFHGKYIPLQGVEFIVQAAKRLEAYPDIRFNLIGSGQTYNDTKSLAARIDVDNINFIEEVPYERIAGFINICDVSLGIFGKSDKASRVIANKIFESIALGRAVISEDSPGIRELFTNGENILLCRKADSIDLSDKILKLYKDRNLLNKIGRGALKLFNERCRPEIVVKPLIELNEK